MGLLCSSRSGWPSFGHESIKHEPLTALKQWKASRHRSLWLVMSNWSVSKRAPPSRSHLPSYEQWQESGGTPCINHVYNIYWYNNYWLCSKHGPNGRSVLLRGGKLRGRRKVVSLKYNTGTSAGASVVKWQRGS